MYKISRNKKKKNSSPMITVILSILVITIAVAAISYEIRAQLLWFSEVLLSISTGIVAGLVLYVLSNHRFSQLESFTRDYEYLRETVRMSNSIQYELKSYIDGRKIDELDEEETQDYLYDVINRFDDLCENLYDYPSRLFDELDILVDSDDDNILESSDFYKMLEALADKEGNDMTVEAEKIMKQILFRTTEINTKLRPVMDDKRTKRDKLRNQPV